MKLLNTSIFLLFLLLFGLSACSHTGPKKKAIKATLYTYGRDGTKIHGAIDPNTIRRVLRENVNNFQQCHVKSLRDSDFETNGVLELEFQIAKMGNVTKADVLQLEGDLDKSVLECVKKVLYSIEFPKLHGDKNTIVDVKQPLNIGNYK